MKTNAKATFFVGLCLICTLFMGFCLAFFLNSSLSADTEDGSDHGPEKTRPQPSRKTKQVDLGGGISLKEVVSESENGEVRMRISTITRNGKRVMTTMWNKTEKNKAGQNIGQGFWHNDKLLLSQEDEDGDGVFDLIVLPDDEGAPNYAFEEKRDGTLLPVSKNRIDKMRKEYKFMLDIMTPIAEDAKKGVNEQEGRRLIKDAIKKAQKGMDDQAKPSPKEKTKGVE